MFEVPVIDVLLELSQLRQVCYPSLTNFLQKEKMTVSGICHNTCHLISFKPREFIVLKIEREGNLCLTGYMTCYRPELIDSELILN